MKKILIVEDNKPMAQALETKMQNSGFDTQIAINGREALEVVEKDRIDLMLIDLIMPELDGFTLIAELKKRGDKTPIIVVSNLGQEEDKGKARKLGVVDYFIKTSVSLEDIVERVKQVFK